MRRIVSIVISLIMVMCTATICFGESTMVNPASGVGLYYVNAESISSTLRINSGKATCSSSVMGKKGTTRIEITMTLQKKIKGSWNTVKTWKGSKNSTSYTLTNTLSVGRGTYRLKSVAVVYKGGKPDTVTKYSGTVKY